MDPSLLNATGLAFTAIGATVLFATLVRRPAGLASLAEGGGGGAPHSGVTEGAAREAGGRTPIALLGYLALMDGFFLQFIASLETMRLREALG
jgi:hypothetical protein